MKLKLFENIRAIPYVPFYLAMARGDWNDEGIDVRVETSPAMSETAKALLNAKTDVSWGGPMRVLTHHDKNSDCPLVCFAQVVARDPFILVGRAKNDHFRFQDLSGLNVAIATEAPTPWMMFHDDLTRAGCSPAQFKRAPNRSMQNNTNLLRSGKLDVIQVFEPYATQLVIEGKGFIWHRFADRGDIAYTSFYTTRNYTKNCREICLSLVKGISRAQKYLHSEPAIDIAKFIQPFFPNLPICELAIMISGYRKSKLWAETPALPVKTFVRLKSALLSGNLIQRDIPYEFVVDEHLSNQETHMVD